jgi:drug/metabolite transporter (DMT)-like permease
MVLPRVSVRSQRSLVVIAFAAVSIVWGATYLGIRIALEGFPPLFVGAIRCVLAGAILYALLRARGAPAPTLSQWGAGAITGGLFFVVGNGLVNLSEQSVSSGLVSVLVATMPLWATLLSRFTGAVVHPREWVGIALGFAGVVLLNLGGELRASGVGAVYALVAPIGWALGTIASRRLSLAKGAMATATQMLAGGALMGVLGYALGERITDVPGPRPMIAMGCLTLFGSLGGFSAYTYLLRHTRTAVATSYAYINPVVAVALGVLFLGERIDLASALGAGTILGAVVLLNRGRVEPKGAPDRELSPALQDVGGG